MDWIEKEIEHIRLQNSYKRPKKIYDYYKLDSNENVVLEKKFINAMALKSLYDNDFREYPLEQFEKLDNKLADYVNVGVKNIGIGNGSDQIMDLILSTMIKGKRVITLNPTFSYFIDRCNLYKIPVKSIDLSTADNSLDFEFFINEAKTSDMIYIASPNNPTGNQFKTDDILNLIESSKKKLVIIDEAYVEFAENNLAHIATKYNNVVIMRTFSKALGLAGARVGYFISNENIVDIFKQYIQLPYPLSSFSMQLAIEVLENIEIIKRSIKVIKEEREKIFSVLSKINGIKIYNSDSNFFFIQTFNHYNRIKNRLMEEKILVKNFGDLGNYKGAMRITIGTSEMNEKVVSTIERSVE